MGCYDFRIPWLQPWEYVKSALELAIARVDELLNKEECGFVHNRLERVKFNLVEAILLLLKEEK